MNYGVRFTPQAWEEFQSWQDNTKILRRINRLISGLRRDPNGPSIGKPEILHGNLSGWRSVRIDDEHRIVYRVSGDWLEIAACRDHYAK